LNLNLYELFDVNPEKALAQLYAGLSPTGDEDCLFALAELSFRIDWRPRRDLNPLKFSAALQLRRVRFNSGNTALHAVDPV
jgi:hypothetical protein